MTEKQRGRWYRFSLRTMFVVVTLFCCWLGWQTSVVRQRRAFIAELKTKPAFQVTPARDWKPMYPPGVPSRPAAKVSLVRAMLGDEAIQEIWVTPYMEGYTEADRSRVAKILPEADVREIHPEPCHPGCFPRGTLVDTPGGTRLIEGIVAGEEITTILASGESTIVKVQSVFITDNRLWKIETDAESLLTTETQPICLAAGGTVLAGKLQPNDKILHWQDGQSRPVQVLAVSPTNRKAKVYNLILGDSEIFVAGGFLARSKPPAEVAAR